MKVIYHLVPFFYQKVIGKMMGLLDQVSITNPMELSAVAGALGSMTKDADDLTEESQVAIKNTYKKTEKTNIIQGRI